LPFLTLLSPPLPAVPSRHTRHFGSKNRRKSPNTGSLEQLRKFTSTEIGFLQASGEKGRGRGRNIIPQTGKEIVLYLSRQGKNPESGRRKISGSPRTKEGRGRREEGGEGGKGIPKHQAR
jgi:hypothetical protein